MRWEEKKWSPEIFGWLIHSSPFFYRSRRSFDVLWCLDWLGSLNRCPTMFGDVCDVMWWARTGLDYLDPRAEDMLWLDKPRTTRTRRRQSPRYRSSSLSSLQSPATSHQSHLSHSPSLSFGRTPRSLSFSPHPTHPTKHPLNSPLPPTPANPSHCTSTLSQAPNPTSTFPLRLSPLTRAQLST